MRISILEPQDTRRDELIEYACNCSWSAGSFLAQLMEAGAFKDDWERVIYAYNRQGICGFCTVSRHDCIRDVEYSPYIGFVFVDESQRGSRVSQHMIELAMNYLRSQGFKEVYLVSDHENLYEKFGFRVIDHAMAPWGSMQQIFVQTL